MKVGDRAVCIGIGYPHWKGRIIEVTAIFDDNETIGFKVDKCGIRVDKEDFKCLYKNEEVIKILGRCILTKQNYTPKFEGCQCYKDCNCREEFKKKYPSEVTVFKVFTGRKFHRFTNLEDAEKCLIEINKQQNGNI